MDDACSQADYPGVTGALAVPVLDADGRAHGALNAMYLERAMGMGRVRRDLPPRLKTAAQELAAAFRDGGFPAGGGA